MWPGKRQNDHRTLKHSTNQVLVHFCVPERHCHWRENKIHSDLPNYRFFKSIMEWNQYICGYESKIRIVKKYFTQFFLSKIALFFRFLTLAKLMRIKMVRQEPKILFRKPFRKIVKSYKCYDYGFPFPTKTKVHFFNVTHSTKISADLKKIPWN